MKRWNVGIAHSSRYDRRV